MNIYPKFEGKELSWSIGLYDTINERNAGYPRMRTVIRAMMIHRPQQLEEERLLLIRSSFDRLLGHVAKNQLRIIEEELRKS